MTLLSNENNNFRIKMSLKKKNLLSNYHIHKLLTFLNHQVLFPNFSEIKRSKIYFFRTSRKWIGHGQL